jgi:hypothetical protein
MSLMDLLAQWMTSKGSWRCGEFSDLPAPARDADAAVQQWTIVAGGLALILSRASAPETAERFAATLQLYDLLRERLRQRLRVGASAALLGETMHEIAAVADPMTKTALQARFQAALQKRAGEPSTQPPAGGPHSESRAMTSSPPHTTRSSRRHASTREAELEDAQTVFSQEVLSERSSNLRRSLATARATGFAELR